MAEFIRKRLEIYLVFGDGTVLVGCKRKQIEDKVFYIISLRQSSIPFPMGVPIDGYDKLLPIDELDDVINLVFDNEERMLRVDAALVNKDYGYVKAKWDEAVAAEAAKEAMTNGS